MSCRQYNLKIDTKVDPAAVGVDAARQSMASRQLRAAQDVVSRIDHDVIGPVSVFYLAGAARQVRAQRAALGIAADELQGRLFAAEARGGWAPTDARVGEQIERARNIDPAAWHIAQGFDRSGVLAIGVDTLTIAAWAWLDPVIVEQLEAIRVVTRETRSECYVANGVHLWKVEPYGSNPYAVMLRGKASTILIKRAQSTEQNPQVRIEMRSAWLWRDGPDRCVATVAALLRRWTDDRQRHRLFRITVSRIDLAVDVDGKTLAIQGDELLSGRWVSRGLSKAQHYQAELRKMGVTEGIPTKPQRRAARARADRLFDSARQFAEYWSGLTYTGLVIGRSTMATRIYNKSLELRRPGIHKPWMRALWRSLGWDGESTVWRVEYQITGEKLRQLAAKSSEPVQLDLTPHLEDRSAPAGIVLRSHEWESVRMALGGIWRYCVGHPDRDVGGWCSLRDPTGNKQRTRWPVAAAWRVVQRARWDLGMATGLRGVEVFATGKTRPETLRKPGGIRPDAATAMDQRPAAWEACQPIAPDGDALAAALGLQQGAILQRWGWGPATFAAVEDFDVDVTSAAEREDQIMPQIVGCIVKLLAELRLQGVAEPGFDDAMMRIAFAMPDGDELHDRVVAKAAATALDAARAVGIRRAA